MVVLPPAVAECEAQSIHCIALIAITVVSVIWDEPTDRAMVVVVASRKQKKPPSGG